MAGSKFDTLDMPRRIAEGNADEHLRRQSAYSNQNGQLPAFCRFIILEVISDPDTLDNTKLSYYEHELKVCNMKYAAVAPRNSVIARRVMGNGIGASERVMVLYPFFPPPIALPAKPGEHVWGFFENPDAKNTELGYWMCRIVQPNFVEDVNYTHADRQYDRSFVPGISAAFTGNDDPKYEFSNGAVDEKDGERYTIPKTASLPDDEKAYEKLLQESDASKQITYESVPRYKKRPGDYAIEGTNNALMVFGTDRTGPIALYDVDPDKGQIPKPVDADASGEGAAVIDTVVGRGQTDKTKGKPKKNSLGRNEIGKSKKDRVPNEGDPDLFSDKSRSAIFQKTHIDKNSKLEDVISGHTSKSPIKDEESAAVFQKSDKVRIVARKDIVILVTNESDENIDVSKCASVIIRTNGDIVMTPAKQGVLKLGGDEAKLAVLCTSLAQVAGGIVTASPILDTMGGAQGQSDGPNGIFATKVLLL